MVSARVTYWSTIRRATSSFDTQLASVVYGSNDSVVAPAYNPLNDLVEMHAARRTVRTAVERHEPRALIVSSTTAAMLLPALPMPYAVRFDAPARERNEGEFDSNRHRRRTAACQRPAPG